MMDVEHTKALEQKATAGPWEWDGDDWLITSRGGPVVVPGNETPPNVVQRLMVKPEDMAFIADARSAVPALVAAVERVRALHTPLPVLLAEASYCTGCGDPYPCPTIEALETP
ncbi:hypothetical protein AS032_08285 [Rhodococcus qingshengii]|nr:hypothetical protein AS032_08285 [Rhodococcus qingshengii]